MSDHVDTHDAHEDEDPVERIRRAIEDVEQLPVEERAERFSAVNEAIVAELNAMEEV